MLRSSTVRPAQRPATTTWPRKWPATTTWPRKWPRKQMAARANGASPRPPAGAGFPI